MVAENLSGYAEVIPGTRIASLATCICFFFTKKNAPLAQQEFVAHVSRATLP
jgi:hypothetical protein